VTLHHTSIAAATYDVNDADVVAIERFMRGSGTGGQSALDA
jgi:hypothetical protein